MTHSQRDTQVSLTAKVRKEGRRKEGKQEEEEQEEEVEEEEEVGSKIDLILQRIFHFQRLSVKPSGF